MPQMHSGSDPLAPPPSFTARKSAASNLPNFELPPPPLSHLNHKFQNFANITSATQPGHLPGGLASAGSLLTPPSTLQSDGLSPISSGITSGSSGSGQLIPPYTPNGYWSQPSGPGYYATGTTPQGLFPSRGLFSPTSLNSIMRPSNSPSSADALPPPSYDFSQQLPPFPASLSMSAPSSLPGLHAQQQAMNSAYMNGHATSNNVSLPPSSSAPQHSPQHQDPYQHTRPPPTPNNYYGHSHSHSSSGPQHSPYNSYGSRPSPHQTSSSNGANQQLSPSNGAGEIPGLQQQPTSQSPQQYQRPFSNYSLPAMSGGGMPGPVMSNLHNPNGQMSLVGGVSNGLITGFNSGHAAQMQNMYSVHSPTQPQQNTERPFKCDQCVQSFNRNHDLKRHKRIHLAVKPFPCGYCDKSFSRKDALKRHILVKGCGKAHATEADSQDRDGSESPSKSEPSDESSLASPPIKRRDH